MFIKGDKKNNQIMKLLSYGSGGNYCFVVSYRKNRKKFDTFLLLLRKLRKQQFNTGVKSELLLTLVPQHLKSGNKRKEASL
jgi:hypothetical protein